MSRRRILHALLAAVAAVAVGLSLVAWSDDPSTSTASRTRSGSTNETASTTVTTQAPTTATTQASTTSVPATTTTGAPAAPVDVSRLQPPQPAGDPAGLAGQIHYAEGVVRDPAASDAEVAEAALAQQVAYRQLGIHPEWDAAVFAALPADLHNSVLRHVTARREFRAMHRRLSSTLPAWRIVAPEPAEVLRATYEEAGAAFGIPWQYLAAIHLVETGTGRIRGTSSAGAQGPMQFMPATWAAYGAGGDINSTRDAIFGAARYLAANGGGADIINALWNYNHSYRYVTGVQIYADLMVEHDLAFRAYHHWGIWYLTAIGDVYLPVGYDEPTPRPL